MAIGSTHRRRGSAAVEFALALPFAVLLLGGVVDAGLLLSDSFAVSRAARDGARVGSMTMEPPPATGSLIEAAAIEAARTSMESSAFAGTGYDITANWVQDGDGYRWIEVDVTAQRTTFFGDLTPFGGALHRRFSAVTQEQ